MTATTSDISAGETNYAMQTWQELATASVLRDRWRIAALKAQGEIILGIDGLQPEKSHETLYLLRDAISHTTPYAEPDERQHHPLGGAH